MTKTASASGTTQKGLHRRPRIVLLCSAYPERIIQAMSSFLRPALVTALLLLPLLTVAFGDDAKPQVINPDLAASDQLWDRVQRKLDLLNACTSVEDLRI